MSKTTPELIDSTLISIKEVVDICVGYLEDGRAVLAHEMLVKLSEKLEEATHEPSKTN